MKSHRLKMLGGSRRTRKVFGMNPLIKLLGYILIAAVVIIGIYLLLSIEKQEQKIGAGKAEEKAAPQEKEVKEQIGREVENTSRETAEPEEYDYDSPYGDTGRDSEFSSNCKRFINDLKSDIDALYEHKIEAQEDYEDRVEEMKRAERKLEEAKEDIDNKRKELEETRQSCIDTGSPN